MHPTLPEVITDYVDTLRRYAFRTPDPTIHARWVYQGERRVTEELRVSHHHGDIEREWPLIGGLIPALENLHAPIGTTVTIRRGQIGPYATHIVRLAFGETSVSWPLTIPPSQATLEHWARAANELVPA